MNKTLKNAIQWTLFVMGAVLIILSVFVPIIMEIFVPDSLNIENVRNIVSNISFAVGLASVGIGAFSIYQAKLSGEQTEKILEMVNAISQRQEAMFSELSNINTSVEFHESKVSENTWKKDDVHE